MKTNLKRKYPYVVARVKPSKVEYYLTVKPNKRVYLQGISKNKIVGVSKLNAYTNYSLNTYNLKNGHKSKPKYAREFYKGMFGDNTIATKLR